LWSWSPRDFNSSTHSRA